MRNDKLEMKKEEQVLGKSQVLGNREKVKGSEWQLTSNGGGTRAGGMRFITVAFLFTLFSFLFLFGCNDAFAPQNGADAIGAGYGRVSVSFTGGQARTAFPNKTFSYAYTFTKGEDVLDNEQPDGSGFFTLEMGDWAVGVQAYVGEELAATGAGSFTLGSGAVANITINLEAASTSGGDGTFTYTIEYPEGITVTTFELINLLGSGDIDLTSTAEYAYTGTGVSAAETVPAGVYLLTVRVDKGGFAAGICEAVHVYPLLDTEYSKVFEDGDFGVFVSIEEIIAHLSSAGGGGNTANPVYMPIRIDLGEMANAGSGWQQLLGVIADAGLFVSLDLSACVMDGTEFDPVNGVSAGKGKIVSITLPEAAESIPDWGEGGNSIFKHFDNLEYVSGANIASIGNGAFYLCSSLTGADFPLAENIGVSVFHSCSLTEADFPLAESIGEYAFANCSNLIEASFPLAESIGEGAFHNCGNLAEVSFPFVESIGEYAFYGCSSLAEANFPLAESTGDNAFAYCIKLTETSFPSAESIGNGAFGGCSILEKADFPLAESIGGYAFYNCNSLSSITIAADCDIDSNAYIRGNFSTYYSSKSKAAGMYAYNGSSWQGPLYDLGGAAAYLSATTGGGSAADPVCLPVRIDLGDTASGASGWQQLLGVIYGAGLYVELDLSACVMDGTEFDPVSGISTGKGNIVSIVLPDAAKVIPDGDYCTFWHFDNLEYVSGANIASIGDNAFRSCGSLAEVSFPLAESIGDYAFWYCRSLTEANIPLVESIGIGAFMYCRLTEVNFPLVESVGIGAFSECSLTEANFPLAESIGKSAFSDCSSLTKANLPLAKSIGSSAFYGCSNLEEAVFPLAVSIDMWAFEGCSSLSSITIAAGCVFYSNANIRGNFFDYYNSQSKAAGTYVYSGGAWTGPF